jgi:hypothetical protein
MCSRSSLTTSSVGPRPVFRRQAAISGDVGFIANRKWSSKYLSKYKKTPTWSFVFSQTNAADPPFLGGAQLHRVRCALPR